MNITPSFFVIAAAYVVTVVIILYWTFKDKIMKPVWGRLVAAIAAFAAVAVGGSMGYVIFGPDSYVQPFITVVTAFGCFFIPYIVLDYNLGQCLFISGVVKCYADDIALLATSLYYLVSDDLPETYLGFPVWPVLLVTAVTFPLIMLFYRKLVRPALDCSGFLKSWSYTWLIPFMVNTMYAFFMQPGFTVISDFPGEKFLFVPYMWVLLTFGTYVLLTLALLGQSQNAQLQEGLHISETQINAQQKQLENLQAHISETSKLRHDMRHHLLAIKAYAKDGKCGDILSYLEKCISFMDQRDPGVWSGNPVVDALLGYYKGNAEDEGIRTELHVETDKHLPVSDTDICIILGNLLENAYEACMRQKKGNKYIEVRLHQTGDVLIIMVENSYEGTVRREDGRFLSSKAEMRKGIGITSVLDVCKKYNGIPKIEYNGSVFKVSILLNGISK